MKAEIKSPIAETMGKRNELLKTEYQKSNLLSSFKLRVGEKLLELVKPSWRKEKQKQYACFEMMLKRYVDLKVCEVN